MNFFTGTEKVILQMVLITFSVDDFSSITLERILLLTILS